MAYQSSNHKGSNIPSGNINQNKVNQNSAEFVNRKIFGNSNGYKAVNNYGKENNPQTESTIKDTLEKVKRKQKKESARKAIVTGLNAYNPAIGAAADKVLKTEKGDITGYTCPEDYILQGTKCTKTSVVTIDATVSTETTTSYKYMWSTSKYVAGWEFTGKTKTESSSYTAFQK